MLCGSKSNWSHRSGPNNQPLANGYRNFNLFVLETESEAIFKSIVNNLTHKWHSVYVDKPFDVVRLAPLDIQDLHRSVPYEG